MVVVMQTCVGGTFNIHVWLFILPQWGGMQNKNCKKLHQPIKNFVIPNHTIPTPHFTISFVLGGLAGGSFRYN
jgi:aminoglycoside N3'-acetyltransferase